MPAFFKFTIMHKDAIILGSGFFEDNATDLSTHLEDIESSPLLGLLAHLNTFHFCTLYIVVQQEYETIWLEYFTHNQAQYNFAINIIVAETELGTGGQIKKVIELCDTEDVLIFDAAIITDGWIDGISEWQEEKMADCTLVYNDENSTSPICACVFRKGFLTLPWPEAFSFKNDYIEKADWHSHQIERYILSGQTKNFRENG